MGGRSHFLGKGVVFLIGDSGKYTGVCKGCPGEGEQIDFVAPGTPLGTRLYPKPVLYVKLEVPTGGTIFSADMLGLMWAEAKNKAKLIGSTGEIASKTLPVNDDTKGFKDVSLFSRINLPEGDYYLVIESGPLSTGLDDFFVDALAIRTTTEIKASDRAYVKSLAELPPL